jgi:plastocyanin
VHDRGQTPFVHASKPVQSSNSWVHDRGLTPIVHAKHAMAIQHARQGVVRAMRRGALLSLALAAALAASAVAVGAGAEGRLHRLHLPPPPTVVPGESADPIESGTPTSPAPPVVTQPVTPPPVTTPPPVVPPVNSAIGCTASGGGMTADATATLTDNVLALAPASVASAPALRFRGLNQGTNTHNLTLRDSSNVKLCGTPDLTGGQNETFIVTNLPPGTYQLYCTIHSASMHQTLTVS